MKKRKRLRAGQTRWCGWIQLNQKQQAEMVVKPMFVVSAEAHVQQGSRLYAPVVRVRICDVIGPKNTLVDVTAELNDKGFDTRRKAQRFVDEYNTAQAAVNAANEGAFQ